MLVQLKTHPWLLPPFISPVTPRSPFRTLLTRRFRRSKPNLQIHAPLTPSGILRSRCQHGAPIKSDLRAFGRPPSVHGTRSSTHLPQSTHLYTLTAMCGILIVITKIPISPCRRQNASRVSAWTRVQGRPRANGPAACTFTTPDTMTPRSGASSSPTPSSPTRATRRA